MICGIISVEVRVIINIININKHGNEIFDVLPRKTFLKLEKFRLSPLVLRSPFSANIHETLIERLCMFFLCFWSLFPQAIYEFRLWKSFKKRDAIT